MKGKGHQHLKRGNFGDLTINIKIINSKNHNIRTEGVNCYSNVNVSIA
jgi:hypothetical protein